MDSWTLYCHLRVTVNPGAHRPSFAWIRVNVLWAEIPRQVAAEVLQNHLTFVNDAPLAVLCYAPPTSTFGSLD
ncbi:MAG TPA: hypothetical protein VGD78_13870, partial [Chthoniobacterales bacterium]